MTGEGVIVHCDFHCAPTLCYASLSLVVMFLFNVPHPVRLNLSFSKAHLVFHFTL